MKNLIKTALIGVAVCSLLPEGKAGNFSVGPKVGTLGAGLEASYLVNPYFSLNGSVNGFKYNRKLHRDDVHYKGSLRMFTLGLTGNLHPFKNGFKVTLGAFYNLNQVKVSAAPSRNIHLSGRTYTPAQVGRINGKVDFNKFSPYLGIGYDSAFYSNSPWSFNCDAGVLYQGRAKARVSATGLSANNPQFLADLRKSVQKSADKFKFYPVLSLGVKYKF